MKSGSDELDGQIDAAFFARMARDGEMSRRDLSEISNSSADCRKSAIWLPGHVSNHVRGAGAIASACA
jgi:hypothetical protein